MAGTKRAATKKASAKKAGASGTAATRASAKGSATTRTARKAPRKAASSGGPDGAFTGFPKGGEAFFEELAAHQDREWFKANKARYESLWQRPLEAFLDAVAERLEEAFPGASTTKRKIFRIYRDVRFSADKSPYKTHAGAIVPLLPAGSAEHGALVAYFHFDASERYGGVGFYELPKDALRRYRVAVASDDGEELVRRIRALEKRKFELLSREALKRVPPGFPQDHPRADLLRRKGLFFRFPPISKTAIRKPELVGWVGERAAEARPALDWVREHAGV
ncbi:MAG: DUF2461 domain-containing protein [Sandaracinaceae bacterium]